MGRPLRLEYLLASALGKDTGSVGEARKWEKQRFARKRNAENAKNNVSLASEE